MEQLTDLKAILHSKRANIYYLDKCRVMQNFTQHKALDFMFDTTAVPLTFITEPTD